MIRAPSPTPDDTGDDTTVLTPLIDIVFMLVVFLLLTANAAFPVLNIETPHADSERHLAETEPLFLSVPGEDGHWELAGISYRDTDSVREALTLARQNNPDQALVVVAPAASDAQQLVDGLEMARLTGYEQVDLATRPR